MCRDREKGRDCGLVCILCNMLPESDSISCFFCIILSNHEPGEASVCHHKHTKTPAILFQKSDKSVQSFSSTFPTGLQLQTTLLRVCHILFYYQIPEAIATLRRCGYISYYMTRRDHHPELWSQWSPLTIAYHWLSPMLDWQSAAEQTSLSLSDLNQTVVYKWTAKQWTPQWQIAHKSLEVWSKIYISPPPPALKKK